MLKEQRNTKRMSFIPDLFPEPHVPRETTRLAYVGKVPGTNTRDSDAWYTPLKYVEAARHVMGSIDLDPFSSDTANAAIGATYIFTKERSALEKPWDKVAPRARRKYPHGFNVWMNPPYSAGMIDRAVAALVREWHNGAIKQAIILVNNSTETQWFKQVREASIAVCFPITRIAFVSPDNKQISGNTRGQVFFYLGDDTGARNFVTKFAQFGWVIHAERGW